MVFLVILKSNSPGAELLNCIFHLAATFVLGVDSGVYDVGRPQQDHESLVNVGWKPQKACFRSHETVYIDQEKLAFVKFSMVFGDRQRGIRGRGREIFKHWRW